MLAEGSQDDSGMEALLLGANSGADVSGGGGGGVLPPLCTSASDRPA